MMKYKQVIIAAAAVIIYGAVVFWCAMDLSKLDDEIKIKNATFLGLQSEMASTGQLLNQLAGYDSLFKSIKHDLYSNKRSLDLIKNINDLADQRNLSLNNFQFDLPGYINQVNTNQNNVQFIAFECVAEGDFINVGKFIESLENKRFISGINNVKCNLSASNDTHTISVIQGSLRLFDTALLKGEVSNE